VTTSHGAGPTIVTAADERYARTLWQLLLSAERVGAARAARWIVADLGLAAPSLQRLRARFPWCTLEPFPVDRYPPHVRRLSSCAWKPPVIDEALRRFGGCVLWLDSATVLRRPLDPVFRRIAEDGVFTLLCRSAIPRWCHPATLAAMGVPEADLAKRCRFGGALGFDAARPGVRELVTRWCEFALDPECIDPPGAGRHNHRYDQSIVTNLLYQWERERGLTLRNEEVDISSGRPIVWFSTRNKVAAWIPLRCDWVVRLWYAAYKAADRTVWRYRGSMSARLVSTRRPA
jgi:hypothetical protein